MFKDCNLLKKFSIIVEKIEPVDLHCDGLHVKFETLACAEAMVESG